MPCYVTAAATTAPLSCGTKERLAPYVTYVDKEGGEHWLFDGFIFLEFQDTNRPDAELYAFETGHLRDKGESAGKAQWQELIDYYFTDGNGVEALEEAVKEAAARLGKAPQKRKVIMVLPDPVIHRHYIDTTSSTTYWGALDGRQLDFNRNEDRIAACKWYIDRVRERFARGNYEHIELAGFYWLREIVTRPVDTQYSYHLTRSDIMLPHIADYLHKLDYTFQLDTLITARAGTTYGSSSGSTRSTCNPTITGSRRTTWMRFADRSTAWASAWK